MSGGRWLVSPNRVRSTRAGWAEREGPLALTCPPTTTTTTPSKNARPPAALAGAPALGDVLFAGVPVDRLAREGGHDHRRRKRARHNGRQRRRRRVCRPVSPSICHFFSLSVNGSLEMLDGNVRWPLRRGRRVKPRPATLSDAFLERVLRRSAVGLDEILLEGNSYVARHQVRKKEDRAAVSRALSFHTNHRRCDASFNQRD